MGRSRRDDSMLSDMYDMFVHAPFWFGPLFAAVTYCLFRWGIPWLLGNVNEDGLFHEIVGGIALQVSVGIAPIFAALVIFVWLVAMIQRLLGKRRPSHPIR